MSSGVWKVAPVVNAVPPVEVVYQLTVPVLAVAASDTLPVMQTVAPVVLLMVGIGLTVANTAVRVALMQPAADVTPA